MVNKVYIIWSIHTETNNRFYVVHKASRTIHSICNSFARATEIANQLNLTASNIVNKVI